MVDSSDEPPLSSRLHAWAKAKTPRTGPLHSPQNPQSDPDSITPARLGDTHEKGAAPDHAGHEPLLAAGTASSYRRSEGQVTEQQNAAAVDEKGDGAEPATLGTPPPTEQQPLVARFVRDVKRIIFSSWINWLLIFVPAGIIIGAMVEWGGSHAISPTVIFAINAVAIIPLASLLSYATESVANRLGDTIGALLNVTFGNAVELIIFIIALTAGEVRVLQAAAIGSILSNLMLILGMCFVIGGLRFREQLYNKTVSQMSACLLCLSVISLLLPTAFHASFNDRDEANSRVLKVSRGTSVVLLLVYILYLLFQLKSHSFMYQSTPQHIIDEESHPGVLAEMLNSSSSSDSSSTSDSDTDSSSGSRTTAKRIKRALRRRRPKSISSKDNTSLAHMSRSPTDLTLQSGSGTQRNSIRSPELEQVFSGDEADLDGEGRTGRHRSRNQTFLSRDFENGVLPDQASDRSRKAHKKSKKSRRSKKGRGKGESSKSPVVQTEETQNLSTTTNSHHPQVVFAAVDEQENRSEASTKRPFNVRQLSEAVKPAFNSSVFPHHQATGRPLAMPMSAFQPAVQPRSTSSHGLRRATSLPDVLQPARSRPRSSTPARYPGQHQMSPDSEVITEVETVEVVEPEQNLSRTSAVILLLASTGLVALCAEFLVGSIDHLVATSGVSQAFIGLIILPIVGNAAEHVTAVTVAAKNKMDLAINIALGSSIQIALFVTPLMVIIGWMVDTDMSLYFSLFETISVFASAFIVSFLMIDGRSNYLEGALLIAAYVIIAVGAFFYPTCDLSLASGPIEDNRACPNNA